MQTNAMRNYYLGYPFNDSSPALPWPKGFPETIQKLADLTRNGAKATMQAPAEPPLRNSSQQATHPFFKPHAPPSPTIFSPAKASAKEKRRCRP